MIVPCECGAKLKIDEAKIGPLGVKVRCPRCGNILPVNKHDARAETGIPEAPRVTAPAGITVLVAHDSPAIRDTICSVLTEAGFGVDMAADGIEALKKATENRPQALVLDVGLPGIYGFELCERLKASDDTNCIKIVLVSSVYDRRRYKRTPVNLYGADDYIEKHHIPDQLPMKLKTLIAPETQSSAGTPEMPKSDLPEMARPPAREFQPSLLQARRADSASQNAFAASSSKAERSEPQEGGAVMPESFSLDASIFQKEECDIPRVDAEDPAAVEKARRFARIIVSDIALYNQEAVVEGLKKGNFYELLKDDISEGRELYEKRVPRTIRDRKDYYQEAFDNFIRVQEKNVH